MFRDSATGKVYSEVTIGEFDKTENGGDSDGLITGRDAVFGRLRLWQDVDHDGLCEPPELHALPDLGLASIDLDYRRSGRTDGHGNRFRYRANVRDVRGARVGRRAWDVFLVTGP